MIDFDGAWKYAIERLLRPLLSLVAPELAAEIDWQIAPVFLDNEVPKIAGGKKRGLRLVDKLVRVQLLDGRKRVLLIHMEVQNKPDPKFPNRMFRIFYRILDKFGETCQVTSLALLSDLQADWCPGPYRHEGLGIKLTFEYPIVKLLALEPELEKLSSAGNPFALIVALHLSAMRNRRKMKKGVAWKRDALFRALIQSKQFAPNERATILMFIDWLVQLPPELDNQVKEELNNSMKEAGMEYTGGIHGTIRILALEEGEKKGKIEGKQEGILQVLLSLMRKKFGAIPEQVLARINSAPPDQLNHWALNLLDSNSPEEVIA